jgi:hypothetical protein
VKDSNGEANISIIDTPLMCEIRGLYVVAPLLLAK